MHVVKKIPAFPQYISPHAIHNKLTTNSIFIGTPYLDPKMGGIGRKTCPKTRHFLQKTFVKVKEQQTKSPSYCIYSRRFYAGFSFYF